MLYVVERGKMYRRAGISLRSGTDPDESSSALSTWVEAFA